MKKSSLRPHSARFKKRAESLIKNIRELSTLCSVPACLVLSAPDSNETFIWPPSRDEFRRVLDLYRSEVAKGKRPRIEGGEPSKGKKEPWTTGKITNANAGDGTDGGGGRSSSDHGAPPSAPPFLASFDSQTNTNSVEPFCRRLEGGGVTFLEPDSCNIWSPSINHTTASVYPQTEILASLPAPEMVEYGICFEPNNHLSPFFDPAASTVIGQDCAQYSTQLQSSTPLVVGNPQTDNSALLPSKTWSGFDELSHIFADSKKIIATTDDITSEITSGSSTDATTNVEDADIVDDMIDFSFLDDVLMSPLLAPPEIGFTESLMTTTEGIYDDFFNFDTSAELPAGMFEVGGVESHVR